MKYNEAFIQAAREVDDRNKRYGNIDECFYRISKIATAFFGREVTPYEVAMILHFTKLGRIGDNKAYADNYVDGISYLAFAAQFAEAHNDAKIVRLPEPPAQEKSAMDRALDRIMEPNDVASRAMQKIATRRPPQSFDTPKEPASDVG